MLTWSEPPNHLLDVDRAGAGRVASTAERQQARAGVGATAKQVDEDGRVEEDQRQLTDAAFIGAPLVANPPARILIPLVTPVRNRAERRFEQLPTGIVVQRALDRARDVRAPPPGTGLAVELSDDLLAQGNV